MLATLIVIAVLVACTGWEIYVLRMQTIATLGAIHEEVRAIREEVQAINNDDDDDDIL